jgi:hypothetical protein
LSPTNFAPPQYVGGQTPSAKQQKIIDDGSLRRKVSYVSFYAR